MKTEQGERVVIEVPTLLQLSRAMTQVFLWSKWTPWEGTKSKSRSQNKECVGHTVEAGAEKQ